MNKLPINYQNFYSIIESSITNIPNQQILAKEFLSAESNIGRYVIGKNSDSVNLCGLVNINGVIDDYAPPQTFWNQIPVIKSSDVPGNAIVVNCVTSISPVTVNLNLLSRFKFTVLGFNEVVYASKGLLNYPWFVKEMRSDFETRILNWYEIYKLFKDDDSKRIFLDILRYRLTADFVYMQNYKVRLEEQYFEDFMQYKNEIFVDAGGFDGDTTEEFCKRYPDYKKVLFFEPSKTNLKLAKKRTENLRDIEYFNLGLSDKEDELSFESANGSASSITSNGTETIEVNTLDFLVKTPVSFIKMDLEGWELKALIGCRNHIITDRPKLAIAVYHNANDFYDIPKYILSLNPNYDMYLRHYTEGWSETVMFFMPK